MYQGSVDAVADYFGERGHPIPHNYNPSDFIMNVAQSVSLVELDHAGYFPKDTRPIEDVMSLEEGKDALGSSIRGRSGNDVYDPPPGILTQTKMLFSRELKNLYRDTTAFGARFGLTAFLSTLIGIIFYQVGASDSAVQINLQGHFGALIMVLLMGMFGT
jgi:hypothetical protein